MSSLVCLHRIHKRQMYVKFNVSTQDTQDTVSLRRIYRRQMYVKLCSLHSIKIVLYPH